MAPPTAAPALPPDAAAAAPAAAGVGAGVGAAAATSAPIWAAALELTVKLEPPTICTVSDDSCAMTGGAATPPGSLVSQVPRLARTVAVGGGRPVEPATAAMDEKLYTPDSPAVAPVDLGPSAAARLPRASASATASGAGADADPPPSTAITVFSACPTGPEPSSSDS